MPKFLISLFTELASVIGGALNGALGTAVSMMQGGTKAALQFHQEGISLARDLGMGLNQANAYTRVLTERTQELAAKYGVTVDAIKAVQRNISETTGKQLLLNNAQAEGFVQANKLVGEQTTNRFMDTIMNGMGGQVHAVQGAISKAYATAAKQGLNAQKFSRTVADNLSMANRLNFRNGINGITRMAAMAEKFGLSMKSVETAAGQFMELDSAIEHSAHLQMLGGSIGAAFGNPLENAYESMYDPEAFAKRMEDAMKGMATFDTKKGYATMSAMNQDILRNYAKEMGLNAEEVVANAKKMAEVRYKENKFSDKLGGLNLSEDQKNFLINNGQVSEHGNELLFNGQNVNAMNPEELKKQLDNMMQFEGKSDTDILKDQALSLKSIEEAITGNATSIAAAFAKGLALDKNAQNIIQHIDDYGKTLQNVSENLGKSAGAALTKILAWIDKNGSTLKNIANGVVKLSDFIVNHWKELLAAILGWKLLMKPLLGMKLGEGTTLGGRLGAKSLGGLKHLGAKAPKLLKVGGAALGVGIGAYKAFTADNNAERGEGIGMATGAVIGTAIAGPLGAAVGGWLGGVGGKLIGEHWEEIKDFAKGAWDGIKDFAKGAWDGIKDFAKGAWDGIKDLASSIWNLVPEDARNAISSGFKTMTELAKPFFEFFKLYSKGAWEVIKGTALGVWDIAKGAAVGAWSVIKGTALGVWEAIKGIALGTWEVVKGMWNGLWDLISAPFSAINDIAEGIKNGFSDILNGNILDGIMTMLGGVGKGVFDIISAPFKAIYDVGQGMWNGIGEFAKGIWNGIGEFAKGIWNGIGSFVKGIWNGIGSFVKGIWNGFLEIWYGIARALNKIPGVNIDVPEEKHAVGGIVGGNSYSGDKILTGLNSGEMVLNATQQASLFNMIKAKPVGEKEYIYVPTNANSSNGFSEVTVKDINVNINGTLKLDTGNFTKNLDVSQLLNDSSFVSQLKDIIKQSINNDMNGGRFVNDNATLRGSIAPTTYWR